MDIQFNINDLSTIKKQEIKNQILLYKDKLFEYLEDKRINYDFKKIEEYEIKIEPLLFGFFGDAQINPETKVLTIFGIKSFDFLLHEWTHILFPNYNCDRHAEGLAFYFQHEITMNEKYFFQFETAMSLIKSFIESNTYSHIPDYYQFIKAGYNFYDSRFGKLFLARAISFEFVKYLIHKIGLEAYLNNYYSKIRSNIDSIEAEPEMFLEFFSSLNLSKVKLVNLEKYFLEKDEINHKYSEFNLPKHGSILRYINRNKEDFSKKECEIIEKIALEDLKILPCIFKIE